MNKLEMSTLSKTWIFDLDGTLVRHNGYLSEESLLPGVTEFFKNNISETDFVIIMTARSENQTKSALELFKNNEIKYDKIITDLPHGERIIYNDKKPFGLKTCYAFNLKRDAGIRDIKIKFCK
mgnify:CR=1 FL=1